MISAFVSVLLASPFLQPLSLKLIQLRLNPLVGVQTLLVFALVLTLLWWLAIQLGSPDVLEAWLAAGRKLKSARIASAACICLALILLATTNLVKRTESASKAISLAKEQLGPSYQYHVSSFRYQSSGDTASVSGVVTAWRAMEVKDVPFQWID